VGEQLWLPSGGQTVEGRAVTCARCCSEVFIKQAGGGALHCSGFVLRLRW
jgi:hypothetical protein